MSVLLEPGNYSLLITLILQSREERKISKNHFSLYSVSEKYHFENQKLPPGELNHLLSYV